MIQSSRGSVWIVSHLCRRLCDWQWARGYENQSPAARRSLAGRCVSTTRLETLLTGINYFVGVFYPTSGYAVVRWSFCKTFTLESSA